MQYTNPLMISLLSVGMIFLAILAATGGALMATLKEPAAQLMRPKAPPAGKRILLERITFIWRRLPFTWKVTARNLFRYKKRLFMTLLGVAGCTALLLAALGLRDSLGVVTGATVTLSADGVNAEQAVAALEELLLRDVY